MFKKIVLLILVLCLFSGCASQKSMYKKTTELNTIEAYKQFLSKHPEGEFTNAVKSKLAELEFEKAKKNNTTWDYNTFLKNYPNSQYERDAKEEIAFLEAKKSNSVEAFDEFLAMHPESKHVSDVLQSLAFLKAIDAGTFEALDKFLRDYPDSPDSSKATIRIVLLKEEYVINNNNWQTLSNEIKKMNSALFYMEDKLLDKQQISDDMSELAAVYTRQIITTRPINLDNYLLLNAHGCMIKKAVSYAHSGSFERALSGSFFPKFIFSLRYASTDDKTKLANIYCMADEYKSSDPKIIKYKNAVLDMLADNINSKAKDPIIEFLTEIKQKEKNKKLLSRINQILSN